MPNESFTKICMDLLEEIESFCGNRDVQDKFPAYFMRRVEFFIPGIMAIHEARNSFTVRIKEFLPNKYSPQSRSSFNSDTTS